MNRSGNVIKRNKMKVLEIMEKMKVWKWEQRKDEKIKQVNNEQERKYG